MVLKSGDRNQREWCLVAYGKRRSCWILMDSVSARGSGITTIEWTSTSGFAEQNPWPIWIPKASVEWFSDNTSYNRTWDARWRRQDWFLGVVWDEHKEIVKCSWFRKWWMLVMIQSFRTCGCCRLVDWDDWCPGTKPDATKRSASISGDWSCWLVVVDLWS